MSFLSFFRLFRCTTAVRPFTMHVHGPTRAFVLCSFLNPGVVSKVLRLCNILF